MERPIHRLIDLVDPCQPTNLQPGTGGGPAASDRCRSEPVVIHHRFVRLGGSRWGPSVSWPVASTVPLRYFLAKETSGPLLVVAERIDAIRDFLESEGYGEQFHPSYSRMVPCSPCDHDSARGLSRSQPHL